MRKGGLDIKVDFLCESEEDNVSYFPSVLQWQMMDRYKQAVVLDDLVDVYYFHTLFLLHIEKEVRWADFCADMLV